ncbi:hypothetical protein GCM10010469_19690 [Streptomyces labedae]|uniref:Uncharacterized protein n=3 Tax=Streptomyces TaxID=1883 RepID=A0ABP7Y9J1_9ACTN|nr:hypothetical protein GCM10010265_29570 [Streptomyces griseoincarnatus]GGT77494.1 hypothetical protein GCM10010287_59810 [Streptomyces variabilis]
MSRPSEWWASVRVSTHGSAENGSGPDGTLTKDVAASADIVVHIAAVVRSRGRTPERPSRCRSASRPSPLGVS